MLALPTYDGGTAYKRDSALRDLSPPLVVCRDVLACELYTSDDSQSKVGMLIFTSFSLEKCRLIGSSHLRPLHSSSAMLTQYFSSIWLVASACRVYGAFVAPDIDLSYATLSGSYSEEYNISYYRKIPIVSPPTGKHRWGAPQPPEPIANGTYDTDLSFPACLQSTTLATSEDCLFLGVYSRPWRRGAKRPVVVELHGGAYAAGFVSFNIPPFGYPTLNASVQNDFIFVYPAYRLNAFGFLPGTEIKNGNDTVLNAGLLDQQAALRWVHDNIEHFGGDPENVAIWGQSAGGGSVIAQSIADGGETQPKLFNRALNSPYWVSGRSWSLHTRSMPLVSWVSTPPLAVFSQAHSRCSRIRVCSARQEGL